MIQTRTLTIIWFLLPTFGFSQTMLENELHEYKLKGKVKSLRETSYEAIIIDNKIDKGDMIRINSYTPVDCFVVFAENGSKIEEKIYDERGEIVHSFFSKYNEKGNKVSWEGYNSNGKMVRRDTFKYNENGNIIEKDEFYFNLKNKEFKRKNHIVFEFNNEGNLIKKIIYITEFQITQIEEISYIYNERGRLVEENDLYDGNMIDKKVYKYSKKGDLEQEVWYKYDGSKEYDFTNLFDDRGNIVEYNHYNENGELETKHICRYDEKNNIIKDDIYYGNGNNVKLGYFYEYDSHGNWIKYIEFVNEKPTYIIERKIVYY